MIIFVESSYDPILDCFHYLSSVCNCIFQPRYFADELCFRDIVWDDIPNQYRWYIHPLNRFQAFTFVGV